MAVLPLARLIATRGCCCDSADCFVNTHEGPIQASLSSSPTQRVRSTGAAGNLTNTQDILSPAELYQHGQLIRTRLHLSSCGVEELQASFPQWPGWLRRYRSRDRASLSHKEVPSERHHHLHHIHGAGCKRLPHHHRKLIPIGSEPDQAEARDSTSEAVDAFHAYLGHLKRATRAHVFP
jgi:hypothetical protein